MLTYLHPSHVFKLEGYLIEMTGIQGHPCTTYCGDAGIPGVITVMYSPRCFFLKFGERKRKLMTTRRFPSSRGIVESTEFGQRSTPFLRRACLVEARECSPIPFLGDPIYISFAARWLFTRGCKPRPSQISGHATSRHGRDLIEFHRQSRPRSAAGSTRRRRLRIYRTSRLE